MGFTLSKSDSLWYERAIVDIEREFEEGLLSELEFRQALRELDVEYDDAYEKGKDDYYE